MKPIVSIIMGSTSDLPVMEKAAKLLDEMHVPFEMNALSAHRTPEAVATGNAQSGECRDGCLDNCPEDLCPGDFLGFVVGFIHGNICFLSV